MLVIFSIAVLSFGMQFGTDNNAYTLLINDSDFDTIKDDLTQNQTAFKSNTDESVDALLESTIEGGDEVQRTGGQFKVTFSTIVTMVTSTLTGGFQKIFGSDVSGFGIVLTLFLGLLTYIGALYVYKAWVGKNPD